MRILILALLLPGCMAIESVPESQLCYDLCVGPYDLGLASHREALGLE